MRGGREARRIRRNHTETETSPAWVVTATATLLPLESSNNKQSASPLFFAAFEPDNTGQPYYGRETGPQGTQNSFSKLQRTRGKVEVNPTCIAHAFFVSPFCPCDSARKRSTTSNGQDQTLKPATANESTKLVMVEVVTMTNPGLKLHLHYNNSNMLPILPFSSLSLKRDANGPSRSLCLAASSMDP